MAELPSGIVTFLFTDIEGSTRLWEQQPRQMEAALARHNELLRQAIEAHHGQIFKTVGDGFCAAFLTVEDALQAAIVAQRGLTEGKQGLKVRMAVHTGEAQAREGDYFGPALSRVARLLAAGHGGQVLVSQASAARLRACLPAEVHLRGLGEHGLRDIAGTEAIYQVLAPGLAREFPPLNTLSVAYRRGLRRAAAVSAVVLAMVAGLALAAMDQAHRANEQRRLAQAGQKALRRHLYAAQTNLAQQAWDEGDILRAQGLLEGQRPEAGQEELRGFEWRYLWRLCERGASRYTLRGQLGETYSVAFSPDGRLLATAGDDAVVTLWDRPSLRDGAPTRQPIARLEGHKDQIQSVAFSPDGKTIASGSMDRTIRLWDVAARRATAILTGHTNTVSAVAFAPDGRILASGSWDTTLRFWDVAARRQVASVVGDPHGVETMAFSPDGRLLASGGDDATAKLWDLAGLSGRARRWHPRRLATLRHPHRVHSVAFSPDRKLLATGTEDASVGLWDVATRQELATLRGHEGSVNSVEFSPDGRWLASASDDNTVKLWAGGTAGASWRPDPGAARREAFILKGHRGWVSAVAFSPDGKTLATGSTDHTVRLWSVVPSAEAELLRGHSGRVNTVAFFPDGKTLVSGGEDRMLRLWDVASGTATASLKGHQNEIWSAAISPDGKTLASGSGVPYAAAGPGELILWDLARKRELATLAREKQGVHAVAFSPDGRMLAAESEGKSVTLWDVRSRRALATLRGHRDRIWTIQFSPDGRTLATAGWSGGVKLWDVATRREVAAFLGSNIKPGSLAFSPDGKMLAVVAGGSVRLWEMATKRLVASMGRDGVVPPLAFSPDGKRLASGWSVDRISLWDVDAREAVTTLKGPESFVQSLAFSPDGSTLACGSADGRVRLWRAASFPEVDPLQLVATGGSRAVTLQWRPLSWALGYRVYRGPSGADRTRLVRLTTGPVTGDSFIDQSPGLVNGRPQTYRVAALSKSAAGRVEEGPLATRTATPVAAPPGFLGCSFNEGSRPGSVRFDAATGEIILRGSGADTWGHVDGCYFLSQPVQGDFRITVTALTRPTATNQWAKAGLMLRESLTPEARSVHLVHTPAKGIFWEWRDLTNAPTASQDFLSLTALRALKLPITLRLTRRGNVLLAEYSLDHGRSFRWAGDPVQFDPPLPKTLFAGLVITSHHVGQTSEAKFSGLEISRP
jgi:WD40 repeat protein/class 3 adenylate cyclase